MMYLVTLPENKLERNGRIAGWHRVPMTREGKRALLASCADLKDKGIVSVCGSDLDSEAVRLVANELHTDYREEFRYRRFNIGRNHGAKANHVTLLLEGMVNKWKDNPIVPVHSGDSWSSLEKRLKFITSLVEKPETIAFVTDARTATLLVYNRPNALLMNGTGLKPGRIYKVEQPQVADA